MKKFINSLILFITVSTLTAQSISLNTVINSVNPSPNVFEIENVPVGTDFKYYDYFKLSENLLHPAYFEIGLYFAFPNDKYFGDYDYITGRPYWIQTYQEVKDNQNYIEGHYFDPTSLISIYGHQRFGINPISGSGYLMKLGFSFNSRYSKALEALSTFDNKKDPIFYNYAQNTYYEPFGPGSKIPAFPWLQDTRDSLVNFITTSLVIDLTTGYKGYGIYDGIDFIFNFEYGPKWLGNTYSMKYPTSDFYKLSLTSNQYLSLYSKKQENGWNWLSIGLFHSNTISHTGGTVIPWNKLPSDRLSNMFNDRLYIQFYGPQFLTSDCITDMSIGLYNYCYFGNVVMESDKKTNAMEWVCSIDMYLHMKLFGFMHIKYALGYEFTKGIKTTFPQFYHSGQVAFYITL